MFWIFKGHLKYLRESRQGDQRNEQTINFECMLSDWRLSGLMVSPLQPSSGYLVEGFEREVICSWNAWRERTWLRATVTHKIKQEKSADLSIIIIAYPWIMQSDIKCSITILLQCTPSNILQPALVRPDGWAIHNTLLLEHRATNICWEPTSCQELYIISRNLLDALWASVMCRALS